LSRSLSVLIAHARSVPVLDRAKLASALVAADRAGMLAVETCHRFELYATAGTLAAVTATTHLPLGVEVLHGRRAARHLVSLAVGRQSTVVGEDQVLHQLRVAVARARTRGELPPELDRLADLALRAGRRARSWLPRRRAGLAELAIGRVVGGRTAPAGQTLIVGAGEMGRQAAAAIVTRGGRVVVTSRTPERAATLARAVGTAGTLPFDVPAEALHGFSGVVIALAGGWPLSLAQIEALLASGAWIIDLSAPPALDPISSAALTGRLTTVDDLALVAADEPSPELLARLERLIDATVGEYHEWAARAAQRAAAEALAERSAIAQREALTALWRRLPALDEEGRRHVASMAGHLAEALLRDPFERLANDRDGRHERAARELFGL
jgi:glutamyl-tRNA reductase